MFSDQLLNSAAELGQLLLAENKVMSLAESCTGGLAAALVTEIAGSSAWFDRGIVSYSNQAKMELLGVQQKTLDEFGAVSEETAQEMAEGALQGLASISASITGIAGPGGGYTNKPVGTVCFAWASKGLGTISTTHHFTGDRQQIREQAVQAVVTGLIEIVRNGVRRYAI